MRWIFPRRVNVVSYAVLHHSFRLLWCFFFCLLFMSCNFMEMKVLRTNSAQSSVIDTERSRHSQRKDQFVSLTWCFTTRSVDRQRDSLWYSLWRSTYWVVKHRVRDTNYWSFRWLTSRVHKNKSMQRLISSLWGTGTAKFQVTWLLRIVQKGVSMWQCSAADRSLIMLMSGAFRCKT